MSVVNKPQVSSKIAGMYGILVTFIASMLGILFGKKAGEKFGKKIEILGGIILIGIGVKILVEHLLVV